jgi:hypothetical protein
MNSVFKLTVFIAKHILKIKLIDEFRFDTTISQLGYPRRHKITLSLETKNESILTTCCNQNFVSYY